MIDYLITAWKDNKETLGDDKRPSGKEAWKAYIFMLAIGLLLAAAAGQPSNEALSGVLTAFAIVAGFTFSTLLFFVDHRFEVRNNKDSREQKALQAKIDKLADEIFININYFNVVCLTLIVLSVIALIRPPLDFFVGKRLAADAALNAFLDVALGTAFYVLVSDAVFTFFRLLARLRYLFDKVRTSEKVRRG